MRACHRPITRRSSTPTPHLTHVLSSLLLESSQHVRIPPHPPSTRPRCRFAVPSLPSSTSPPAARAALRQLSDIFSGEGYALRRDQQRRRSPLSASERVRGFIFFFFGPPRTPDPIRHHHHNEPAPTPLLPAAYRYTIAPPAPPIPVLAPPPLRRETLLKAYYHAELLKHAYAWLPSTPPAIGQGVGLPAQEAEALRESLATVSREWPRFVQALQSAGWQAPSLPLDGIPGTRVNLMA